MSGYQERVDELFDAETGFWEDVYARGDLYGVVFRERSERALAALAAWGVAPGARVLEVGCGAGVTTVELARRGHRVSALDTSDRMVAAARRRIAAAGVDAEVALGDVHGLPHDDATFDAAVALGVLPWLHTPAAGLAELARVLRPGGCVVVTCDNRRAAQVVVDPRLLPALGPAKLALQRRLGRTPPPWPRTVTQKTLLGLVRDAGLEPVDCTTIQFGPFTLLGRPLVRGKAAVALHRRLQRAADRGTRVVSRAGMQHFVVARRP